MSIRFSAIDVPVQCDSDEQPVSLPLPLRLVGFPSESVDSFRVSIGGSERVLPFRLSVRSFADLQPLASAHRRVVSLLFLE